MTTENTQYWAELLSEAAAAIAGDLPSLPVVWNFQVEDLNDIGNAIIPLAANREAYDRTSDRIVFTFYLVYSIPDPGYIHELFKPSSFRTDPSTGATIFITNIEAAGESDLVASIASKYAVSQEGSMATTATIKKITAVSYPRRE